MKKPYKKSIILMLVTALILSAFGTIIMPTTSADAFYTSCSKQVWEVDGKVIASADRPCSFTFTQTHVTKIGSYVSFSTRDVGDSDENYIVKIRSLVDDNYNEHTVKIKHRYLSMYSVDPTKCQEGDFITVMVKDHRNIGANCILTLGDSTGGTVSGFGGITAPDITAGECGGNVTLSLKASKNGYASDSSSVEIQDTNSEEVPFCVHVTEDWTAVPGASVSVTGGGNSASGTTDSSGNFHCTVIANPSGTVISATASANDKSGSASTTVVSGQVGAGVHIQLTDEEDSDSTDTCFLAGTSILMASTSIDNENSMMIKNIEDIRSGDIVMTVNSITGKIEGNPVSEVQCHKPDEMKDGYLEIVLKSSEDNIDVNQPGDIGSSDNKVDRLTLKVTPEHPILVYEDEYLSSYLSADADLSSDFDLFDDGNKLIYVKAGDLKKGDKIFGSVIESIIAYPRAQEDSYHLVFLDSNLHYILVPEDLEISLEEGYLPGFDDGSSELPGEIGGYAQILISKPTIAPGSKGGSSVPLMTTQLLAMLLQDLSMSVPLSQQGIALIENNEDSASMVTSDTVSVGLFIK